MVFIYIYTLSKQRWHFSLREYKALAIDIFTFIKKTLIKEYVQASSNSNASALSYILIEVCHKLMTLFIQAIEDNR